MTDFIFCNVCCKGPTSEIKFYITSCYHLLCGKCFDITKGPELCCVLCKKPAGFKEINKSLDSSTQKLFKPTKQLCNEFCSKLKKTLEFQQMLFQSLFGHYKEQKEEYDKKIKLKELESEEDKKAIAELRARLDSTRHELKEALNRIQQNQKKISDAKYSVRKIERRSSQEDKSTFGAELEKLFASASADVSRESFTLSDAFDDSAAPGNTGISFMMQAKDNSMNRSIGNSSSSSFTHDVSNNFISPCSNSTIATEIMSTPKLLGVGSGTTNKSLVSPLLVPRKGENPYMDMMCYSKNRKNNASGDNRSTPSNKLSSYCSVSPSLDLKSSSSGSVTRGRIIPKVLTPSGNSKFNFLNL